ncbi:conserved hypothetical protein [Chlamydia felis Fe/C-56]|uniref:Uncharacterized protein n=1 Tax=Chlamydia felis (strain Fe/C-56) TaxID=264202 RepID=Q254P6_CHLFF|nr:hypothetical protein [Chlamydia felis]BAE81242.1 conserved hypothetical protein [Chlamydia felis Fe/C-56]
MTVSSLNNRVASSNSATRNLILNLTDRGKLNFTNLDSSCEYADFLENQTQATSRSINKLATTDSALYPSRSAPEIDTAFSIMTTSGAVLHCVEHLCWISLLCRTCCDGGSLYRGGSGSGGEFVIVVFILGILAALVLGIFGSSLGSAILSAIKIHKASNEISNLKHRNRDIYLNVASFQADSQEKAKSKAVAIVSVEANKHLISAYKNYRAVKISFLICAIICTLALLALAAGAILSIFFSGPMAAAIIPAAIIGCCAGGGGLLLTGLISFMIASVYMSKKQNAAVGHLNRSMLYTMIADQMVHNANEYNRNEISQTVVQQCIANYPITVFNYRERSYLNAGLFSHNLNTQMSPSVPSAPPPPYDEEPPPSYDEVVRSSQT